MPATDEHRIASSAPRSSSRPNAASPVSSPIAAAPSALSSQSRVVPASTPVESGGVLRALPITTARLAVVASATTPSSVNEIASSTPARSASSFAHTYSARETVLTPASGLDGSRRAVDTMARRPRSRTWAGTPAFGQAWTTSVACPSRQPAGRSPRDSGAPRETVTRTAASAGALRATVSAIAAAISASDQSSRIVSVSRPAWSRRRCPSSSIGTPRRTRSVSNTPSPSWNARSATGRAGAPAGSSRPFTHATGPLRAPSGSSLTAPPLRRPARRSH